MSEPREYHCLRCGIYVYEFGVLLAHPENVYCAVCRFLEPIPDENERESLGRHLGHPRQPPTAGPAVSP